MHCFNHKNAEAIGLCKHCSKGLCDECAADLGHGLACKGIHEEQVEAVNMIIEKNTKVYAAAPQNTVIAPIFYLFMGIVFASFGYQSRDGFSSLSFVMGVGFIVFAVVVYVRNKALFNNQKNA
jgi:hypothetical protein